MVLKARKPSGAAVRLVASASLAAALAVTIGCEGHLPVPPYAGQPETALSPVRYPPPPARAEFVPARPSSASAWVDGEWTWRGRRWGWRPGRWIVPPRGARFSPWTLVRGEDGTLYFASGAWRDAKGQTLPEPATLAVAKPTPGAVVNPEGEREITAGTLRTGAVDSPPVGSVPAPPPSPLVSDSGSPRGGESPGDGGTPSTTKGVAREARDE